jgi:hypothetical protein
MNGKPMKRSKKFKGIFHMEESEYSLGYAIDYLRQTEELLQGHCDVAGITKALETAVAIIQEQKERLQADVNRAKQEQFEWD